MSLFKKRVLRLIKVFTRYCENIQRTIYSETLVIYLSIYIYIFNHFIFRQQCCENISQKSNAEIQSQMSIFLMPTRTQNFEISYFFRLNWSEMNIYICVRKNSSHYYYLKYIDNALIASLSHSLSSFIYTYQKKKGK